jgi:hypothetical protein
MSHKSKPPRQSPAQRGPRVVKAHAGIKSVNTHLSRKTITDAQNGRSVGMGNATPEGARAPGSLGPAQTTNDDGSSW